jgi:hypothetical protein
MDPNSSAQAAFANTDLELGEPGVSNINLPGLLTVIGTPDFHRTSFAERHRGISARQETQRELKQKTQDMARSTRTQALLLILGIFLNFVAWLMKYWMGPGSV